MTTSTDLDRRLAAFLDDGPSRASDRPIDAALDHARAHPRHRDPLRALRRDPMGTPWLGGSGGMRALPLVAALGLLLVAGLAAASVGGWFDRDPGIIVVPSPSASPVPPSPSPSTPATIRVDLVETVGADAAIEITDESFTLVDAVSSRPGDGGSVPTRTVAITAIADAPNSVQLTWTVMTCETLHQLVIAPDGRSMTLFVPRCEGDTFPRDLILVLTFDGPVTPAEFDVTVAAGG